MKELGSLEDSHSTVHSEQSKSKPKSRFYAFKNIKEGKIRERNQSGAAIFKTVIKSSKTIKLQALDDARTIESHFSPKSSIDIGRCVIQESIIIMRGNDISSTFDSKLLGNDKSHISTDNPCQFVEINSRKNHLLSRPSGLLCSYCILKENPDPYTLNWIQNSMKNEILQLYAIIPLTSPNYNLVIFEPYLESLDELACRKSTLTFKQFMNYLIQIIKILCYLRDQFFFPSINPSNIKITDQDFIKFLVLPEFCQSTEESMAQQVGQLFIWLLKNFCQEQHRVEGLTNFRKLELLRLTNQILYKEDFSFEEVYLRLQSIN